jgi:hypothetical protein
MARRDLVGAVAQGAVQGGHVMVVVPLLVDERSAPGAVLRNESVFLP